MDPLEVFEQVRKAQKQPDRFDTAEINDYIRSATKGTATNIHELASLVRAKRNSLTEGQEQASRESVELTIQESPSKIPQALRGAAAGLQTFGQGITFGGGDELAGAASFLGALAPGGESPTEAFTRGRAESNQQLDAFRREHPVAAPLLQAAGGITSGLLLPGAAGGLTTATKLGTAARGAAVGAGEGVIAGALSGEGIGGRALGAAAGGGLGGIFGGVAGVGTAFITRIIDRVRRGVRNVPAKRSAVNIVRDMIDETGADNALIDQLPKSIASARGRTVREGRAFTLGDTPEFRTLTDDVASVIRDRAGLQQSVARTLPTSLASDLAGTAAVAPVQGTLAAGRGVGTVLRRVLGKADEKDAAKIVDELSEILNSTNPKVQRDFIKQVSRSQRGVVRPPRGSIGTLDRLFPPGSRGLGPRSKPAGDIFNPLAGLTGAAVSEPEGFQPNVINPLLGQ